MKRLLIVIPRSHGGGAELQSNLIKKYFDLYSRDIIIEVLYVLESKNSEFIGFNKMLQLRLILNLRNYIKRNHFDYVYSFLVSSNIVCSISTFGLNVKHIVRESSNALNAKRRGYIEIVRRLLIHKNALIIANSIDGKRYWQSYGYNNVFYVPNMIEDLNIEIKKSVEKNEFYTVGRLVKSKNILMLVKLFNSKFKNKKLHIVGDGPLRSELKKYESDSIIFYKYSSETEAIVSYKCRYFISASLYEGMPNSVLKAAVNKKELILSNIKPHLDIFDEDEVHYFSNSRHSLETTINELNPQIYKAVSQNTLKKFKPERVVKMLENLLK